MPAIQPARLKKQVSDLAGKFDQPTLFVREIHAILDLYTDHTQRPGQSGEPLPLIATYKAPPQVMRQIWHNLVPRIEQQPNDILPLCDALWKEQNYDLKLLAARLLGYVPVEPANLVLERLDAWAHQGLDNRILDGLFRYGFLRLQKEEPGKLFELVSAWLDSADLTDQHIGLRALLPIIDQSGTEKLPSIFRMITPYLRVAPSRIRMDILEALTALAHYSPSETAYLLRQNLSAPDNPDTAWLIRQAIHEFPEDIQSGLRDALREKS